MIEHWCKENSVFLAKENIIEMHDSYPYQKSASIFETDYIIHQSTITIVIEYSGLYFDSQGWYMDTVTEFQSIINMVYNFLTLYMCIILNHF